MKKRRVLITGLFAAALAGLTVAAIGTAGAQTTPKAAAAAAPSGTLLRAGTSLYPRAVRLQHSGSANGRIISSVIGFSGGQGQGVFSESTNDGSSFAQVGTVSPPGAANNLGLCCGTLFEMPSAVGSIPAGTLLWAASVGQSASNRRMDLQIWQSRDTARTWSYLSSCYKSPNTGGLWEPEFAIDGAGKLECYFSDETTPATHSQAIRRTVSSDGVNWSSPVDVVAPTTVATRPGMPTVRKLPNGRYVMTYEVCALGGAADCEVNMRTSADGVDWGTVTDLGTTVTAVDGKYFAHAPTLAWVDNGTAQGRLLLVGQVLMNADGSVAAGNGNTLFVNTEGGAGGWYEIASPVSVPAPYNDPCPNYSSALAPLADGTRTLEIATGYVGTTCQAYFATASIAGSGSTSPATSGATYRLVNVESRICLDVSADSRVSGGNIQQWTCNGLAPQNFVTTSDGSGYYTLKGQNSGLCVSVAGGSTTAGANVDQETCNGSGAQAWKLTQVGAGYVTAVNKTSSQCLDVAGGSTAAGANVEQWTCNSLSPQIWNLQQR